MNDLTNLPPNSSLAKQILSGLSPGLRTLLIVETSSERAVREIATVPIMRAEAETVLPALRTVALSPSGAKGVRDVIGRRFTIYPQPERSDGEWDAFWDDYCAVLEDVPASALEAGMLVWLKNPANEFLPKPAQLHQLAMQAENRDARAYDRAKKACEYRPEPVYEPSDPPTVNPRIIRAEPTEADKARVKAWAAEFVSQARHESTVEIRANHGPTDEKGITPELRAVMARQNEGRA